MDSRLIRYHYGELPEEEAAQVKALIDVEEAYRSDLESLERLDLVLEEIDRRARPTAAEAARAKETLKRKLKQQQRIRLRTSMLAVAVTVSGAAAAVVAIIWYPRNLVVGTVQLNDQSGLSANRTRQSLHTHSRVVTGTLEHAQLELTNVARIRLTQLGTLTTTGAPDTVVLLSGRLDAETLAPLRIVAADGHVQIRVAADAEIGVRVDDDTVDIDVRHGAAKVIHHGEPFELLAPARRAFSAAP